MLETSTAITNVKYVNELMVFPFNPSNGQIRKSQHTYPINIQVFDLLGKLVFENNKPLLVNKIDLNTAKGIYFVKTEFSNGIATEK
ncbi:MAG: T9SS type A sorting domain-containing protein [Bacteroidetes bacterium]|nr:T9SS type A sorting domain-containing protein [Bacteroidota bacterium]